jgi:hypothetical protein
MLRPAHGRYGRGVDTIVHDVFVAFVILSLIAEFICAIAGGSPDDADDQTDQALADPPTA